MMRFSHFKTILVAALAGLTLGGAADTQLPFSGAASTASSAAACTRLASSSGSDSAAGTPAAPWQTAKKLLSSLQPGDVACLASGQTFSTASTEDDLNTSNVTLQSSPGGSPAVLLGLLYIGGSNVTVTGLSLNGHNTFTEASNPASVDGQAGVFVVGNNVTVSGNDIYNGHSAICMEVGLGNSDGSFVKPTGAVITGNRIHACGVLPQTREEHGIYLLHGTGTVITSNLFYDIADFGIQLYPDSTNTLVDSNVIASTGDVGGIVVSAENNSPSSGNTIRNNIITHTHGLALSTYWGGAVGTGNVATNNCEADVRPQETVLGLTITGTKVVADAGLDANYMLHAGSGCVGYGPSWIQPGASGAPPAAPPAPPGTKPPTGGGGGTTPPRGGQATPPTGGVTTAAATHGALAITITSPLSGGTPAAKKAGTHARTFSFLLSWKGGASKTYQVRLDKGHWFSVKGPKHTFKHLRAGKHKVTVRLKGTRGHATTRIITVG